MAIKTIYINNVKLTRNFALEDKFAEQAELIQQINSALKTKRIE